MFNDFKAAWLSFAFLFLFPVHSSAFTLMSYNVENLFDAYDDGEDQGDPTYLPLALKGRKLEKCNSVQFPWRNLCRTLDWTEEKYQGKLESIANVIASSNGGFGPDVLVLSELENRRVIEDLAEWLREFGYTEIVHFESPGFRGIDVGLLSRIPVVRAEAHPVNTDGRGGPDTRDILEVELWINGNPFLVVVNHWPSQGSKTEKRIEASKVLHKIVKRAQRQGIPLIAAGDFNTLENESPNPITSELASPNGPLVDLGITKECGKICPPTSYYYRTDRIWNRLDRFLVSKNLFERDEPFFVLPDSLTVLSSEFLFEYDVSTSQHIPRRFNFMTGQGYSDHLPILVKIHSRDAYRNSMISAP